MANKRETLLKIVVGVVVGLFVLDRFILTPSINAWKAQTERLEALREKVEKGKSLIERETSLRGRWADMLRTDLTDDNSAAEADVYKALGRWGNRSRVSFNSLMPGWPKHDGYDTFECRVTATGDQASLGRLLYEIETDPLPARIEECEFNARDGQGKQLTLTMRFSFVRINETARVTR
jgi:hypothetical protein